MVHNFPAQTRKWGVCRQGSKLNDTSFSLSVIKGGLVGEILTNINFDLMGTERRRLVRTLHNLKKVDTWWGPEWLSSISILIFKPVNVNLFTLTRHYLNLVPVCAYFSSDLQNILESNNCIHQYLFPALLLIWGNSAHSNICCILFF